VVAVEQVQRVDGDLLQAEAEAEASGWDAWREGVVGAGRGVLDVRKADTCAVACYHRARHRMADSSPLANKASSLLAGAALSYDEPYVLDADPGDVNLDGADPGIRESSRRVHRQREEDLG
jgi:hypothetical protein